MIFMLVRKCVCKPQIMSICTAGLLLLSEHCGFTSLCKPCAWRCEILCTEHSLYVYIMVLEVRECYVVEAQVET